ncbi:serine/threonine-protein kinase ATG1c-like isoform X2 [Nymphaea colorata]|uniref:serine/threonine-protein kinase ATG1c-like isoform X2 n=1 Tax=Nymphaea colorata TaxID=210225 RepID=UPI00129D99B9|nr:serine/threonine-protein kinase ATG1c-like isoform X2 [Nymphaea colorata]
MGSNRGRVIGDYKVCEQVGSGSFSVVWRATHRSTGSVFAIKEIQMQRLTKKLQESLLSEIVILRKINHPNIIRLHDIIETPGKIHLVLEYCRGGDLSMYIHNHGKVPEATAKHFMHQLASGLSILREHNIIHRDLKPQNLLLSSNDNHAVLKIADFGFARPLQPRDLAETLCGSPLYMAPEIMQLLKYDAKADLWSVGAILFQLVTGKTPFSGNNQEQLRQNIIKSNGLRFPPDSRNLSAACVDLCQKLLRCNPVERLTFEEFFNHQFISERLSEGSLRTSGVRDESGSSPGRLTDESSQEDCLPFHLDDESSGPDASPSFQSKRTYTEPTPFAFPLDARIENRSDANASIARDICSRNRKPVFGTDCTNSKLNCLRPTSDVTYGESPVVTETLPSSRVMDSQEIVEDYVIVPGPPVEVSSSAGSVCQAANLPSRSDGSQGKSMKDATLSSPMPIAGVMMGNMYGSLGSNSSAPSGTSLGSVDIGDVSEQPSTDCVTRIRSLQQCASAISEIVTEKIECGKCLEAFSVQLVILAIWKQAVNICHAQAASASEPNLSQETVGRRGHITSHYIDILDAPRTTALEGQVACSTIEKDFLLEVGRAEELARELGPVDGGTEMPDAVEIIFQFALALGRYGGVEELMGNMESAASLYAKAVRLFFFLLVEAPSLILNPPLSLTNADRMRLRNYIDILNNRKGQSRSMRMALLNCGEQTSL